MSPIRDQSNENFNNQWLPTISAEHLLLFPGTVIPVSIHKAEAVNAIKRALEEHDGRLFVVNPKETGIGQLESLEQVFKPVSLCRVERLNGDLTEGMQVLFKAEEAFHLTGLQVHDGEVSVKGELRHIQRDLDEQTEKKLSSAVKDIVADIVRLLPGRASARATRLENTDDAVQLLDLANAQQDGPLEERNQLLGERSLKQRFLSTLELLQKQRESLKLQHEIGQRLTEKMNKQQRQVVLREQLKAIQEELEETEGAGGDQAGKDDYMQRIEAAGMPSEVSEQLLKEAKRLKDMPEQSPEVTYLRNYLDLVLDLPWSLDETRDAQKLDLDEARKQLDSDHYGLEKVKKRLIEHLAVAKLKGGQTGQVLLLVGPPGVGKTSLGQSIATALGREFTRSSLGGVRDEAEIRGHRRTYVGAMPGRIIQALKRVKTRDPVFQLDEIDKLSQGYGGDPQSALLEVLDPEQNHAFMDHYVDAPFDLSKVFFVATANSLDGIPAPLLDRMEVLHISGYTQQEKQAIARKHLWPKSLKDHGLQADQLTISEQALAYTIKSYTREPGVRKLKRQLDSLCRGSTEAVLRQQNAAAASSDGQTVSLDIEQVREVLGPEPFSLDVAEAQLPPGVVTGLAWTPAGGDILFVEAKATKGKGGLTITGQLGDVMRESLQIAMTHVRAALPWLNPTWKVDEQDIHVHVPSGAIPKDGPSAGITMLTTLASLISNRAIDPKTAMTGELTLRGAVLPVGGIKEKVLAAHQAGVDKILLSKKNEKDLHDIPEDVRSELQFVLVETAEDVLLETLDVDLQQSGFARGEYTFTSDPDLRQGSRQSSHQKGPTKSAKGLTKPHPRSAKPGGSS